MTRFDQYIPAPVLQPYIKYYAISEQEQQQVYRVLPGTSLVMGFQYKGNLATIDSTGGENQLSSMGVTGLQDSVRLFSNSAGTGTVLVYFTEAGASFFFRTALHELFAQSLSLEHFIPSSLLAQTEEQLREATTDYQRIHFVEELLISQLRFAETDLLVQAAIRHIKQSNGVLRIKDLAQQLHTSQSPLEKRFRKIVGTTPKKFASIIRLQSLISEYPQPGELTRLGFEYGYYDQAHFIKDFRGFTGETPEQFFRPKQSGDL